MTPDNIILIQLCIIALALFTGLHFAWQANYYRRELQSANDSSDRQASIIEAKNARLETIHDAVKNGKSGTARKIARLSA